MYVLLLSFLTAFALSYIAIPSIIRVSREKHLFDEPGHRSSHTVSTPSLGGVAIFAGAIFSIVLWTPFASFGNLQYILCSSLLLFLIGLKDDLTPMPAKVKLVGQILAAAILVFKSKIFLSGLYGVLGITAALPFWLAAALSVFTILVIINAFNLIDGINGLSGSVATLIATTLGCWFYITGHIEYATLSFATTGAVLAFLRYNFTPARIFMGDTGSLFIGLVSAILVIQFIVFNEELPAGDKYKFDNVPAVAISIMILPLFDTLRVFATRILRGQSPFTADRRHIHHLLIDRGFSHMQSTAILVSVNVLFITTAFTLHNQLGLHTFLLLVVATASALTYGLQRSLLRKRQQSHKMI